MSFLDGWWLWTFDDWKRAIAQHGRAEREMIFSFLIERNDILSDDQFSELVEIPYPVG